MALGPAALACGNTIAPIRDRLATRSRTRRIIPRPFARGEREGPPNVEIPDRRRTLPWGQGQSPAPTPPAPLSRPGGESDAADRISAMATTATTGFSRAALEQVSMRDSGATGELRQRSFGHFEVQPMPSPETEEWRYTDLRELDLDSFTPFAPEPKVAAIGEVKPDILEAAARTGERSGLAVQHNPTVVAVDLNHDAAGRGVTFGSLDE